jgi:hypothetical protein
MSIGPLTKGAESSAIFLLATGVAVAVLYICCWSRD